MSVVLHVPSISDLFILCTNTSGVKFSTCYYTDGVESPVVFYSRLLRGVKTVYSVTKLGALAIVAAILYFNFYTYNLEVVVYTDHKAYTSLHTSITSRQLNKRLKKFALKLQDRQLYIRYRQGKANGNADGLCHQDWDKEGIDEMSEVILGYQNCPI